MTLNRISTTLTQADRDTVMTAISTIKNKLPFLVDLSPEDRKTMTKMGDKSRAFVTKALEVATQNPDFLPRSFDLDEMRRDVELFEAMYPIVVAVSQLHELIDDTAMAAASESMTAALQVYHYAKASGQGSGLEGIVGELGQRFARKPRKAEVRVATVEKIAP